MVTYTYLCLVCLEPFDATSPNRQLPAHNDARCRERRLCTGRYGWLIGEYAPSPATATPSPASASGRPGFGPWTARYDVVVTSL